MKAQDCIVSIPTNRSNTRDLGKKQMSTRTRTRLLPYLQPDGFTRPVTILILYTNGQKVVVDDVTLLSILPQPDILQLLHFLGRTRVIFMQMKVCVSHDPNLCLLASAGGLDNTSLKLPWRQTFSQFSMMTHMGGSVGKEHVMVGAADDCEYVMNVQQ